MRICELLKSMLWLIQTKSQEQCNRILLFFLTSGIGVFKITLLLQIFGGMDQVKHGVSQVLANKLF